jgi:hypothetical protein
VGSTGIHRRAKRIREAHASSVAGDTLREDRARIPLKHEEEKPTALSTSNPVQLTADERVAARILRRSNGQQEGVQEWLSSGYRWWLRYWAS